MDKPKSDDEFQSKARRVVRGVAKVAWIPPVIIAAMEMLPQSEAMSLHPKPVGTRQPA